MAKKKRQRITEVRASEDQPQESIILWQEATIKPTDEGMIGKEWAVTIIGAESPSDLITVEGEQFIRSKNGRLYSVAGLAKSAPMFEGAKVYDNHLTQEEFERKQGMRSPSGEWLGTIVNAVWDAGSNSIKGVFKVVEDALATKLKNAWDQGVLDTIGLSIDTFPIIHRQVRVEGQSMSIVEGFQKILSVDLVAEPAAGGSLDRMIAARQTQENHIEPEASIMDEKQVKALIAQAIGDIVPDVIRSSLAEALAEQAGESGNDNGEGGTPPAASDPPPTEPDSGTGDPPADPDPDDDAVAQAVAVAAEAMAATRNVEGRLLLSEALQASNLSATGQEIVRQAFKDRTVEANVLNEFVKTVKKSEANGDASGRVSGANGQRPQITGGLSGDDKFEIEFMRLMMKDSAFKALEGDKEDFVQDRLSESRAWDEWAKAGKPKTGNYRRMSELIYDFLGGHPLLDEIRFAEASTLATVTKNTVNIMVAADYSLQQRWYESIVTTEQVDTIDDATLARFYGVDTLAIVNKGAAYTELAQSDEEETAAFIKKGNYIAVPMEDIMQDKLNYFRQIPRRLSDTWYNTLSEATANVFTLNSDAGPVLATTGALFNNTATSSAGGHANLLTTALSFTNYGTARTAMRVQTNQPLGAGRKVQITPRFLLVPEDLETAAIQIRNSEQIPASANNDVNPFFQKFDIVVVPDWSDTNNWALVADPKVFPQIFHIFPRGGATPQLFTADNPLAGSLFTNDTLRFKIRMMTYHFSSTYDCSPVADFRGLHKNNVA